MAKGDFLGSQSLVSFGILQQSKGTRQHIVDLSRETGHNLRGQ